MLHSGFVFCISRHFTNSWSRDCPGCEDKPYWRTRFAFPNPLCESEVLRAKVRSRWPPCPQKLSEISYPSYPVFSKFLPKHFFGRIGWKWEGCREGLLKLSGSQLSNLNVVDLGLQDHDLSQDSRPQITETVGMVTEDSTLNVVPASGGKAKTGRSWWFIVLGVYNSWHHLKKSSLERESLRKCPYFRDLGLGEMLWDEFTNNAAYHTWHGHWELDSRPHRSRCLWHCQMRDCSS